MKAIEKAIEKARERFKKLNKRYKRVAKRRQCGGCSACCEVKPVLELRKPMYASCVHQCKQGCVIYGQHPDECQSYRCGWKMGIVPGDHRRPDLFGVLFDLVKEDGVAYLDVYPLQNLPPMTKAHSVVDQIRQRLPNMGVRYNKKEVPYSVDFAIDEEKYPYHNCTNGSGNSFIASSQQPDVHYCIGDPAKGSSSIWCSNALPPRDWMKEGF